MENMSFDEWLLMTEGINTSDLTDEEYEMTWNDFIQAYEEYTENKKC